MSVRKVFVRHPYNYDGDEVSVETGLLCADPSLAEQSEKEEADINTIVKRFGLTGIMPEMTKLPTYGDFTHVSDYRSALEAVQSAQEQFMSLPAEVRAKFGNDPAAFVDFCSNDANKAELDKLGLLRKEEPATVTLGDVVNAIKESASGNGMGERAEVGAKPA